MQKLLTHLAHVDLSVDSRALVGVQPSVTEKEETEKKHCTELINMATE